MKRTLAGLIFVAILFFFLAAVACGFLLILSGGDIADYVRTALIRVSLSSRQEDLNMPAGSDNTPQRFTVNIGDTPLTIALNLTNAGLIRDAQLFVDYVRVEELDSQLEAGIYFLNQTQTLPQIALILTDSRSSHIPFRILEGMRLEEIADLIDQNRLFNFTGSDFAAVVSVGAQIDPAFAAEMGIPVGASLEGFLFPNTYQLPPDITATGLRDTLLEAFRTNVGLQLISDVQAQGLTMRDAVILASIVEREAVWDDEHPMIASVYRNRLAIGMRLEADPTVQYALNGTRGRWWVNISIADYRGVISPYNTYLNNGLPPGPIASPGISAIRAAIHPAESSYYFFRAKCDGSNYHIFATTYDEHLANGC